MKLKSTSLLLIGLTTALVGCFSDDTVSSNTQKAGAAKVTIQGLGLSDSAAGQDVTILSQDGDTLYVGQTDSTGAFELSKVLDSTDFPLQVSIGDSADEMLEGQIQYGDLDREHKVGCTFSRHHGMHKGHFGHLEQLGDLVNGCDLPIPSESEINSIMSYVVAGKPIPETLLPKLSDEQKMCVEQALGKGPMVDPMYDSAGVEIPYDSVAFGPDFGRDPFDRGEAEKICNLPALDSATLIKIQPYVEKGQPIPEGILPALTDRQKSCMDSVAQIPARI